MEFVLNPSPNIPTSMAQAPIDALCRKLLDEFRRDSRGTRVAQLLGEYAASHGDWEEWALFDQEHYTRNLVHRCGDFELLLLAWGAGQSSPIHDHSSQQCWMAVLDGVVEEVHFRQREGAAPVSANPRRFQPGQVAYIEDEIALHLVRPADNQPAVSLHLYSNPIDSCRIYDPASDEVSRIDVGYHSVRGELCGVKSAEAIRAEFAC